MKIKSLIACLSVGLWLTSCETKKETSVADYNVVPMPKEISYEKTGCFTLTASTKITFPQGNTILEKNANFLAEYIKEQSGIKLSVLQETENQKDAIQLRVGLSSDNKEAYQLSVNENNVLINGASEAGVFYGIQTQFATAAVAVAGAN